MKIVASNSLTLSNVNDGTITHTAYAYSADGTDKFTTTYPNLNLLEGSKDFSGDWWLVERSENDGTYKGLTVKKSEGPGITKQFIAPKEGTYTFSAYVKSSGNNANIIRAVTLNDVIGKIVPDKSMGINFGWLRDSFQVTLKAGDKIYAQYNVAGSGVLWNAGHKWEEGSAATDDLTANYPNLNLLEGSKKYTKDSPKTLSSSNNDGWFFVDDVFAKNLKAGTYTMNGKADAPWTVHDISGAKKGHVGLWLVSTTPGLGVNISLGDTVPKTIEVPKDGDYCVRVNLYSNGTDMESHKFWDFKLEPGSTATPLMPSKNELQEQLTPWMPSLSEVTTSDWPKYRGEYSDMSREQSTYSYDYSWSLIRGDDGKPGLDGKDGIAGKDGVGIKTTVITYAISTNGATAPATGWTSSVPSLIKGQYLWTKTIWTYTDNSFETGYSVSYISKDGNNGNDGIAGKDGVGIKKTTITYAVGTSGTTAPASGWNSQVPNVLAGQYLWTKTVWDYTDKTSETGYSVAKMGAKGDKGDQGVQGLQGLDGTQGVPGPKGVDGVDAPTITVKSYTNSAGSRAEIELTGPNAFKKTVYNRGHNVWVIDATTHKFKEFVSCDTYTTMSFSHNGVSTTLADYLASLKDSIIVIAASDADSVDQNVRDVLNRMGGFPDLGTWGSWRYGHVFIGMSKRNDGTWPLQPRQGYEEAINKDGSAPEIGCTLSKGGIVAKGADGRAGKDGKGIKATAITYQASTNGTTAPTGTWSASVPTVAKGSFLWTRTIWTYTDNTTETGYAVAYMGTNGNNGINGIAGKDGTGIKKTTITYAVGTSGTTAPASGWNSQVPNVPAGQYLWTKTVWDYTDKTSETGYSVAMMGAKGDKGDRGNTGPEGPAGSNGHPGKIVSDTEPSTRFKGLTWKYSGPSDLTASDGTVILSGTEYYWSGTNWILSEINAHNINGNNLKITDGEFVSTIIDGPVQIKTEIKDDYLMIHKMDTSTNSINTSALKSDSGLAMTYQNSDTGEYTSAGVNFQGLFMQNNITHEFARLTPQGTTLSSDVPWTKFSLMNNFTGNIEYAVINGTVYISASGVGVPAMTAGQWKQAAQLPTGSSAIAIRANRVGAGDSGDGLSWAILSNQAGGIFIRCSGNKAPTPNLFNATLAYPIG